MVIQNSIFAKINLKEITKKEVISEKKGISAFTLKLIACLAMFIGNAIVIFSSNGYLEGFSNNCFISNLLFQGIGRIAFPIVAFLMAEKYFHTKNREKYLSVVVILAIISEVPYDLCLSGKLCDLEHQNMFFTLALGFSAMMLFEKSLKCLKKNKVLKNVVAILSVVACMSIANYIHADYSASGVLLMFIFFITSTLTLCRDIPFVIWVVKGITQITAILDVVLFHLYNGTNGYDSKLIRIGFCLFYPMHLLVLYGLRFAICG